MTIFRLPRWIRRIVRRRMNPMSEEKAWSMKDKLSVAYAVIAWNAFGFVCYACMKGKLHWPVEAGIRTPEEEMVRPAIQWAHTLGMKKASVYRVSGTTISEREYFEVERPPVEPVPTNVSQENDACRE